MNNLISKKIRFFLMQSNDTGLFLFKEFYFGYLLNLLIDRLGFKLRNIEAEIVYPFNKYIDDLFNRFKYFDEEVFVFYLENSYHSNNYSIEFVKKVLDRITLQKEEPPMVFIYSFKISKAEAFSLMNEYNFIKVVIRTDIEYFFNEIFSKGKNLSQVDNIIFRDGVDITQTNKAVIDYGLDDYIVGGHYSGYLDKFKKSKDYIASIIDEDTGDEDELITYKWPKSKKLESYRYNPDLFAMISTGRGCKYNCTYCYRGIKYSKVRQIGKQIIKKDLDYLETMYYEYIYIYDDCFATTNKNRLEDIIKLLNNYKTFYYGISIRYEICSEDVLNNLLMLNLYRVQIGLQSISIETNNRTGRLTNKDDFKNVVNLFMAKGTYVSIDIILGLPGENLKDFINTLNYAVALKPGSIHINTLFINPGTKLYKEKEKYGLKLNTNNKGLFSVPTLISSNTFSEKDIELAKEYTNRLRIKNKDINIILR